MSNWFHNDEPVTSVDIDDRGFQYADGLFETIAVRDGKPRLWQLHLQRLQLGCRRMQIVEPNADQLLSSVHHALAVSAKASADALVKVIVTRGAGQRGYQYTPDIQSRIYVGVFDRTRWPSECYASGVAVRLCTQRLSSQPQTAGIKTLARSDQISARSEWSDKDVYEGLMRDQRGFLICGTMTNVLLWQDSRLLTPAITHCGVSGIMRQHILTLADEHGVAVEATDIPLSLVDEVDEMMLCNSQIGLWRVGKYGDRRYSRHDRFDQLTEWLRATAVREAGE